MPDTPVNILLVIANQEYGGGQRTFEVLAGELPSHGFAFHVACDEAEPFWGRMGRLGACRHAVRFHRTVDVGKAGELARLIRQERIDVVHSQSRRADFYALLAARRCGVPSICSVAARTAAFDVPSPLKFLYGAVERWMESRATLHIAVAESVRQALIRNGAPPERVVCIPEAIDTARARPGLMTREDACRTLGLDPAKRWVGSLGRLIPLKGFDVLVKAAAGLRDLPDIGILLAGAGPEERRLRELARTLHVEERVRFLPFTEDLAPLYAAVDLLAFTSLWGEGFPRMLLEGMAFGTPVIASDLPAAHDVLGDSGAGRFVPIGDAEALAEAIRQVMGDAAQQARMGEAGRRYAVERYDVTRLMPRVAQAYRSVLA